MIRVMLVEDDSQIRAIIARLLRKNDFEVVEASSGEEALSLVRAESSAVDLLMTDIVMPGINGFELARAMRERWANLKVLYVSGYVGNALAGDQGPVNQSRLLMKPFTFSELTSTLTEFLS